MFDQLAENPILMAGIMALFGVIGQMLGGGQGMIAGAAVRRGDEHLVAYWFSDKMVLRMYRAQQVDETSAPQLYNMVKDLAGRAGLPMPKVYLIDEAQPNAFATGRNPENAAVAATTGILQMLTPRELRGVMAHELAHVKHRDILISTIAATVAGAISALANFGMFFGGRDGEDRPNPIVSIIIMIVAPIAGMLIQMAISRAREFEADRGGAEISGDPTRSRRRPGENRCLCSRHSDAHGRRAPRDGTDDDHEPLVRRRSARVVQHSSLDRGAHRAPACAGTLKTLQAKSKGGSAALRLAATCPVSRAWLQDRRGYRRRWRACRSRFREYPPSAADAGQSGN